jgi:hypothetical protein
MAYFPDIGMSIESVILANIRLAPIQVSNYGHPVSTFGAKVDYWIGGRDTEDPDRASEHYSERLVLIPGCGQAPVPIQHPPSYPQLADTPVLINCSWAGQKINDDHLQRLAEITRRVRTPVAFKFFPGGSVLENRYLPLRKSLEAALGAHRVQVFGNIGYSQYMTELEAAHFALDAHPFGGYNTAVDLLTPTVVMHIGSRAILPDVGAPTATVGRLAASPDCPPVVTGAISAASPASATTNVSVTGSVSTAAASRSTSARDRSPSISHPAATLARVQSVRPSSAAPATTARAA